MIAAIHGILEQVAQSYIPVPFSGYAKFDQPGDYGIVPYTPQQNALTMASFFIRARFTTTQNLVVIEKSNDNTNFLIQTGGGNSSKPAGCLFFGKTAFGNNFVATPPINDGNFHTVGFTYQPFTGIGQCFCDGQLSESAYIVTSSPPPSNQNWLIGSRSGAGTFVGDMAHFMIYNRVITLQEFKDMESGRFPVFGLVGGYPMQGDMNDISMFANHGTKTDSLQFYNL